MNNERESPRQSGFVNPCNLLLFLHGLISSEQERTLQVELERIQALRGQLEDALGRSLERLNRLDSLDGIGGGEQECVAVLPKHAFWALAFTFLLAQDRSCSLTQQASLDTGRADGYLLEQHWVQHVCIIHIPGMMLPGRLWNNFCIWSFPFSCSPPTFSFPHHIWLNKDSPPPLLLPCFVPYHKCMCEFFWGWGGSFFVYVLLCLNPLPCIFIQNTPWNVFIKRNPSSTLHLILMELSRGCMLLAPNWYTFFPS